MNERFKRGYKCGYSRLGNGWGTKSEAVGAPLAAHGSSWGKGESHTSTPVGWGARHSRGAPQGWGV